MDLVAIFEEDTHLSLMEAIRPDVMYSQRGLDYTRATVVGHELVKQWAGPRGLVLLIDSISTSVIVAKRMLPDLWDGCTASRVVQSMKSFLNV